MILSTIDLRSKAHELALTHDPSRSRQTNKHLRKIVQRDLLAVNMVIGGLSGKGVCAQPAEEWLLDHAEFIEDQALVIEEELSTRFAAGLPYLNKKDLPRALSICESYMTLSDGIFEEHTFRTYVEAYQEVAVLTIGELWTMPILLRIALLRRLAEITETIAERREVCHEVEKLIAKLEPAKINPQMLRSALDEAGHNIPLSGPFIVYLIQHLREWADDALIVREWLICKLENEPEQLDRIVSYEHQWQAACQMTTGNLIGSLRHLSRLDWYDAFEHLSIVEQTLREDHSGDYPRLDYASRNTLRECIERLSRRLRVPENLIAQHAVDLSAEYVHEAELPPREAFLAYYLLEAKGIRKLIMSLRTCSRPRSIPETKLWQNAAESYFSLVGLLFAAFLFAMSGIIGAVSIWSTSLTAPFTWLSLAAVLLLAFPALEWAVTITHGLIAWSRRPIPLLRYDFSSGVPSEALTMVVIPVIWSTATEVKELADRLELHYLANRAANIHYGLLGDLKDAGSEKLTEDEEVLATARECIERLNRIYPGKVFHLYHRSRQWNESEGRWIGWERKRGKLVEFVELLNGKLDTSFNLSVGDGSVLPNIRYVISLDADTLLPTGSAQRMIGAMHLPYNRPRLNRSRTRVVEGYGVLQPRIGMSHEASYRSRFAYLLSGDTGVDPYAFAVSDPYQDGFGQGIFTGKGIIDVGSFAEVLCERIPENRVLSHDLLEGGLLRAGLLSDVELVDSHPTRFYAYQQRLHRWVRGDWQLIPWLFAHNENRRGYSQSIDLTLLTRWQIVDNMRRSLLPPILIAILLFAWIAYPEVSGRYLVIVLATIYIQPIRSIILARGLRQIGATFLQATVHLSTIPYQALLLLHAIAVTLFRLSISKRRLLEWTSSAEVERRSSGRRPFAMKGLLGGVAITIVLGALSVWRSSNFALVAIAGLLLCVLWLLAPLLVRWLDQPVKPALAETFTDSEREKLHKLAREIWSFFQNYVTASDHDLPPDNVQIDPPNGVARRTSPTNIGLYLASVLAARDFGFIETSDWIARLERTLTSLERMERWEGHFFNWYDTSTLTPLIPKYVSTVDSGNFVACLITVREGLAEWLEGGISAEGVTGNKEDKRVARKDSLSVAFAEELTAGTGDRAQTGSNVWLERGQRVLERLDALIAATDFRPLYDHKAKLFSLGYHEGAGVRDNILYDLMASEARQASFIAIAMGQVSVAHWQVLGRTMTRIGKRAALLSWSGTMFEYLMPWLLMRTYPGTLWDQTYRMVLERQLHYAKERGVPMGISESGYYAFDHQMNYQYRAFGVPGLGFKRGLEEDLVVSPYSAILALPYAGKAGLQALREMEEQGAKGDYGYFEAIDFTAQRMPKGKRNMIIRSYMAHHQGMSFLTLANLLLPRTMVDLFHRNKQVRATELLLQERIPVKARMIRHPAVTHSHTPMEPVEQLGGIREYDSAMTRTPQVCLLSNGTYSTIVSTSGSGYSGYGDLAVTRWREDPIQDDHGSYLYIRNVTSDACWSPSYQPCRKAADEQHIRFGLDKVSFDRMDGNIRTSLDICIVPDANAEIRRLTLSNSGDKSQVIEVTTYQDLAIARPMSDNAHPAFSKLFIRTEYIAEGECLAASRRPRKVGGATVWAAHALMTEGQTVGSAEFETDRARFIGRGSTLSAPQGIRNRLTGTTGAVVDPVFVMRRRVNLAPGEQLQLFAVTAVADTKEKAIDIVRRFQTAGMVDRAFGIAWNRSQIELRHLDMNAVDATIFQTMAGQVLYAPPLRPERESSIISNKKGLTGLWAHGISGDRQIVLVFIEEQTQLPFITKLLRGHEYLRRLGLGFDLVVMNESQGGYQQDLQDSLKRMADFGVNRFGADSSGVHIVNTENWSEEERMLLVSKARILLHANGPSLRSQLRLPRVKTIWPDDLEPTLPVGRFATSPIQSNTSDLLFFNGNGGFSADGRTYRMVVKKGAQPPAPWINVIANPRFGCLVSELGAGYTWWRNSRECKLTPWSNDPVLDPPAEICYVRDDESGELWTGAPTTELTEHPYSVTHGRGFTSFTHERNGIAQEQTVFVPREDTVKLIKLTLRNQTSSIRQLSITYYATWVIGVQRQDNASFVVSEWEPSAQILIAHNTVQETFRNAHAFLGLFTTNPLRDLSYTVDREEFIGRNHAYTSPAALNRVRLSGRTGAVYDSCGAVQAAITLAPDEEQTVYVLIGCEASREGAIQLAKKYSQRENCEQALAQISQYWNETIEQIVISTPSKETDLLMNGWLLYQSLCCRMWARSGFYQAGGAYGYRDQLQDSLAFLHARPDITRQQIILHAAHQYEEGDVQHWWHEETHRGIRTLFSDDLLWLPYAVARYIEHTGDEGILKENAPYLYSELLKEGEHERYEETVRSDQTGTIMDHCLRAIERSLSRFGEHGLPLIGVGDWNDGMNLVGDEGRGESVWLGWFLCMVLEKFIEFSADQDKAEGQDYERAERYRVLRDKLIAALDEYGWDGAWYRRAFTDEGSWLGSIESEECRIDAIAQSWAVISGAGAPDKVKQAMASFDRELVDRDLSLVRLLTPAFDHTVPSPGYIQGYPPGIRENGAQYTHGALWSIIAWCKLGQGEKAFELFHMMNPITHTRTPHEVRQYVGEPYVVAADVYTGEPHRGHAGWTWYTGAAGWMYQAGLEWILGIRRRGDRLYIAPCIPREWPEYAVSYRFGATHYQIKVMNPSCKSDAGEAKMQVDDQEIARSIPDSENGPYIELVDDGKEHQVVVTL